MTRLITLNELKDISDKKILREGITLNKIIYNASQKENRNIFLSYSSKDSDVLPAVIEILEGHNGRVYIDKGDNRLPNPPSVETAEILKDTIKKLPRMVVFVTDNSKDSKWIPWELGLGDGAKTNYDIAIFPSSDKMYDTTWLEQEYLGLYRRIVWGKLKGHKDELWMVLNFKNNTANPLSDWLDTNSTRGIL